MQLQWARLTHFATWWVFVHNDNDAYCQELGSRIGLKVGANLLRDAAFEADRQVYKPAPDNYPATEQELALKNSLLQAARGALASAELDASGRDNQPLAAVRDQAINTMLTAWLEAAGQCDNQVYLAASNVSKKLYAALRDPRRAQEQEASEAQEAHDAAVQQAAGDVTMHDSAAPAVTAQPVPMVPPAAIAALPVLPAGAGVPMVPLLPVAGLAAAPAAAPAAPAAAPAAPPAANVVDLTQD